MKRLVLLVFAFFCVGQSFAQRIPQDLAFGLRGGLGFATVRGDDVGDLDWRIGFMVGGVARVDVAPAIGIQPEVLFVQKGAVREGNNFEVVLEGDYVQLPVLVVYDVTEVRRFHPYIAAGPAVGIRVNESLKFKLEGEDETISGDEVDVFNRMDLGLVVGAGVGIAVRPRYRVTFDARYDLGLVDIAAENFGGGVSARTSTIVLSLGVMVRWGAW